MREENRKVTGHSQKIINHSGLRTPQVNEVMLVILEGSSFQPRTPLKKTTILDRNSVTQDTGKLSTMKDAIALAKDVSGPASYLDLFYCDYLFFLEEVMGTSHLPVR